MSGPEDGGAGAAAAIAREVLSWPGVSSEPGRFGSLVFRLGRRELGHLHGDAVADLPLPSGRAAELRAAGLVEEHRFVPGSGWSTVRLRGPADVERVIQLLREAYERGTAAPGPAADG